MNYKLHGPSFAFKRIMGNQVRYKEYRTVKSDWLVVTCRTIIFVLLMSLGSLSNSETSCVHALDRTQAHSPLQNALQGLVASARTIDRQQTKISRSEIIEMLRTHPNFEWIAEDLIADRLNFAMNARSDNRVRIARLGFQNQYQTRESGGIFDPTARARVEAAYMGMSVSEYRKIPLADRLKYGFLAPAIGSALLRDRNCDGYGDDTYIFRKDRLRNRTTWLPGDSLDQFYSMNGAYNRSLPEISATRRFLPWNDRDLMLPYLEAHREMTELRIPDLGGSGLILPNGQRLNRDTRTEQTYIELQFFGELNLDDVESFIFTGEPPTGAFLRELQRRGIRIYQHVRPFGKPRRDNLWWQPPN